jgi:hypothetical protein
MPYKHHESRSHQIKKSRYNILTKAMEPGSLVIVDSTAQGCNLSRRWRHTARPAYSNHCATRANRMAAKNGSMDQCVCTQQIAILGMPVSGQKLAKKLEMVSFGQISIYSTTPKTS